MYLKQFHLREEPFATTPDPRFLFKSPVHQQALDRIMTSVSSRRGINAIIGEPGLGKSMLIRTLLKGFNDSVHFAWVFNTTMNSRELLRYICHDFGFAPKGDDLGDLLIELYTFLIREYEQSRFVVLIIDEAQNLKPEVLEEIRQLSNLETASQKLLQVILSGQPQLDQYLNDPALVQLKQRISLKATLNRLNQEDSTAYVLHRLKVAGVRKQEIFSPAALEAIFEISDGIPRLINQVCDNALMSAAEQKLKLVDAALVLDLLNEGKVMVAPALTKKHHVTPVLTPAEAILEKSVYGEALLQQASGEPFSGQAITTEAAAVPAMAAVPSPVPAEPQTKPEEWREPQQAPRVHREEPAVELEFAAGFDGLDLGELSINW
jgi:general secretion pathway protein A